MTDKKYIQKESKEPETLAQLLFPVKGNPVAVRVIEEYRIAYERIHGPTDLTKYYTSMWPGYQQRWLIENEPKRYFDGFPPFGKAFVKEKLQDAARLGKLDDIPDSYLQLFLRGEMNLDDNSRGRE